MRLRCFFFLPFAASVLFSQNTGLPPADPLIHVSVNLVQLEAVVTGAKDMHIGDLRPEDFEVAEDGIRQKITNFSYIVKPPAPPRPKNEPPLVFTRKLRPAEVRRAVALILDDIHTSTADIFQLRFALKKFIAEQIGPEDLVSLSVASGGMGFYEQFTSDPSQLAKAIDRVGFRAGDPGDMETNPGYRPAAPANGLAACQQSLVRFQRTMNKIQWAANSLSALPGRKAVAFFSGNFAFPPLNDCPDETSKAREFTEALASLASRSGVAIYSFDARGLQLTSQSKGQEVSQYLSAQTGGKFFGNSNDSSADLGAALDDLNGYYLIGYQPDRAAFELRRGAPVFHKTTVKVLRKGLSVRHTKGFLGDPNAVSGARPAEPDAGSKEAALREALLSPFDDGTLRVKLTPIYGASVPDAKKQRRSMLTARLNIDGTDLKIIDAPDGRKQLILFIVVATFRSDGGLLSTDSAKHTLDLSPEQVNRISLGLGYETSVTIPKAGPYQLRVAVRDDTSGATGSANGFVWIPDFNKDQLALSSLVVSESGAQGAKKLAFRSTIYGAKMNNASATQLETSFRVFHQGNAVFDSGFAPLQSGSAVSDINFGGSLNIPGTLAPGEYSVELIVRDRLAKTKQQTVSQWAELTIAPNVQN